MRISLPARHTSSLDQPSLAKRTACKLQELHDAKELAHELNDCGWPRRDLVVTDRQALTEVVRAELCRMEDEDTHHRWQADDSACACTDGALAEIQGESQAAAALQWRALTEQAPRAAST